jgi:elongation factor Ts
MTKDIAMHIAATNPSYLISDDIPGDVLEREKQIYKEQALAEGKPEKIIDRIIQGKLNKYYEEVCLLNQKFVKDTDITIETLINNMIAKTGENILLRRFARFQLGEDI